MSDVFDGASVLFDLDGAMIDTAPDLVRALNAATAVEGLPPTSMSTVHAMVGRGAKAMIKHAYARAGAPCSEDTLARVLARFLTKYEADIAAESRPFPGLLAALDELAARGARLSVCTNKTTHLAVKLLEALGLSDRFERIVGRDSAPAPKPDPSHVLAALGDGDRMRAVFVGDSVIDVAAARAAGVPVIVTGHGYREGSAEALGGDAVAQDFSMLTEMAERLLRER